MKKNPDTKNQSPNTIHIIAGPTAGGKSALALALAAERNGVIINADSMQVYDGLPILTARPGEEDMQRAPHALYGVLHPNDPCSAGLWRTMAMDAIEDAFAAGRTPIVVGGTGFYFKALMEGLSPIPEIDPAIRAAAVALQKDLGNPGFHAALAARDPVMAARLHPHHTARLLRAWEVLEATGKSLAVWQAMPKAGPPQGWTFAVQKILPPRDVLYASCDARFLKMLDAGAMEEALAFQARIDSGEIRPDVLLTHALGFRQLVEYGNMRMDKESAIAAAQTETRQYAKRQMTWFRNQM